MTAPTPHRDAVEAERPDLFGPGELEAAQLLPVKGPRGDSVATGRLVPKVAERPCDHCNRFYKPRPGAFNYCSFECRFWSKVDVRTQAECWPWKSTRHGKQYGHIDTRAVDGYPEIAKAHRVAFELAFGRIRHPDLVVGHACDNPPCCNPYHLWCGTTQANTLDRDKKGRAAVGERAGRVRLTEEQVLYIRNSDKSISALSKELQVPWTTIRSARNERSWKHLSSPLSSSVETQTETP